MSTPLAALDAATQTTPERRDYLIRYYLRLNEYQRSHLHERQRDLLKHCTLDEFSLYTTLIKALAKHFETEQLFHGKELLSDNEQAALERTRIDTVRGQCAERRWKRRKIAGELEQMRPLVKKLRHEGLSWREVEVYLRRFHKIRASFAYIRRCLQENDQTGGGPHD